MKKRFRMLFGLSLALALSITVPVFATGTSVDEPQETNPETVSIGQENDTDSTDTQKSYINSLTDDDDTADISEFDKKQYLKETLGIYRPLAGEGWQLINNKPVYFNSEGQMTNSGLNGWLNVFGNKYWFKNGILQTGWQQIDNSLYYLSEDTGIPQTGWFRLDEKSYYANSSGIIQTGWMKFNDNWYYFNGSGVLQTGFYTVGNSCYYSDTNGIMQTGWLTINGNKYCFNGSGAMYRSCWYGDYYFLPSGIMATNQWVGNKYVGEDGKYIPGYDPEVYGGSWVNNNGVWYYKMSNGQYISGKWKVINGVQYYFESDGAMATGWKKLNGEWYYFESSGAMVTGWKTVGSYKYYFNSYGQLQQDLDGILAWQTSYQITVNRQKCQVMVYAKDSSTGNYNIPVKTFACSVGLPETPTPTGTWYTPAKYRWHELMGPSYGQYCTRITPQSMGILFHSVAGADMTSFSISSVEYNKLGSPASHGCVRLCVRDAKWIYDHCPIGTKVTISDTAATPFDKPSTIKIPYGQNWDPTDPAV